MESKPWRFVIEKAQDEGFTVTGGGALRGDYCPVVCAGDLEQCLDYVRRQFPDEPKPYGQWQRWSDYQAWAAKQSKPLIDNQTIKGA